MLLHVLSLTSLNYLICSLDCLLDDDEYVDGEYDLQDEEENALLDDGTDSINNENEGDEEDILQLDETIEIAEGTFCCIFLTR